MQSGHILLPPSSHVNKTKFLKPGPRPEQQDRDQDQSLQDQDQDQSLQDQNQDQDQSDKTKTKTGLSYHNTRTAHHQNSFLSVYFTAELNILKVWHCSFNNQYNGTACIFIEK